MYPILFQNSELVLYSYPLLMGVGWGVAYQIFFSLITVPRLKAQILFWGIFFSAWLGAKILFVLTAKESTDLLLLSSFWTGGGFVFYGGLIGGFLFVTLFKFVSKFQINDLWAVVPALTFGHAIGRVGCFLAGCCYGKPTDSFFSVFMHDHNRYPTQLIEAAGLFIIGFILIKSNRSKQQLLSFYLITYGLLRFVVEQLRGDLIRGAWGPLTPSQWISLFLISVGVTVILSSKSKTLA